MCAGGSPSTKARLPVIHVTVDDVVVNALVDSGCSKSIVSRKFALKNSRKRTPCDVVMINGDTVECQEIIEKQVVINGKLYSVNSLR